MLQEFYQNNLQTTFIKQLLTSTPHPLYDVVRLGDRVVKDAVYLYDFHIIKVTQSGIIGEDADYKVIDHWQHHQYIPNITQLNVFENSYYDLKTHRYLGDLLRIYKNFYYIDLMGYYNCYDGSYWDDLYLNEIWDDAKSPYVRTSDNPYTVYVVPIKFNKTYTIAINSNSDALIYPCFKNKYKYFALDDYAKWKYEKVEADGTKSVQQLRPTKFYNMSFNSPKTFSVYCDDFEMFDKEKYLYLMIQIKSSKRSSLVVLEGDYTKDCPGFINTEKFPIEDCNDLFIGRLEELHKSKLDLLKIDDKIQYAYDDEIIPYLLHHTITNMEEIAGNIQDIQDIMPSDTYTNSIWDNRLKISCYNKYFTDSDNTVDKYDINGFVNKKIEEYLKKNKTNILV